MRIILECHQVEAANLRIRRIELRGVDGSGNECLVGDSMIHAANVGLRQAVLSPQSSPPLRSRAW